MKKNSDLPLSLPAARWLSYATAGVATTLTAAHSAEAKIHYSGPVNYAFNQEHLSQQAEFPLDNSAYLRFHMFSNPDRPDFNFAGVEAIGPTYFGYIRGSRSLASRLELKDKISQGPFTYYSYVGNIQSLFGAGNFKDPGTAFVGFVFYGTSGEPQYGWARIKLKGAPSTKFILLDYAWGDVGDSIKAGQKRGGGQSETTDISKGSLGLLALGAAGLDVWRENRALEKLEVAQD